MPAFAGGAGRHRPRPGDGRATIRAVRVDAPLRIDGRLDEAVYRSVPAISDFIQIEPRAAQPATREDRGLAAVRRRQRLRDARAAGKRSRSGWSPTRCGATAPTIAQNDHFAFTFDTFYDRRNGVAFNVNADRRAHATARSPTSAVQRRLEPGLGASRSAASRAAGPSRRRSRSSRCATRPGRAQVWGFQARRINRWKNESSFLTRDPGRRWATGSAMMFVHRRRRVVGLEAPSGSRNLEIKPYAVGELQQRPI